jgi:hypothetical protein
MEPKELAAKFAKKVVTTKNSGVKRKIASLEEQAARRTATAEVAHALSSVVRPFLEEVKSEFEKDAKNRFQIRLEQGQNGELISLSFKVGRGPILEISNYGGVVIVGKSMAGGTGKNPTIEHSAVFEPHIATADDLTRGNIAKLIEMAIDDA